MFEREIAEIKNILKEYETRIESLEKLFAGAKRKKITTEKKSILDHFVDLKSSGFFDSPKTLKEIVDRLAQESFHYSQQSLTEPLQRAVRQKILGRLKRDGKWGYCKR